MSVELRLGKLEKLVPPDELEGDGDDGEIDLTLYTLAERETLLAGEALSEKYAHRTPLHVAEYSQAERDLILAYDRLLRFGSDSIQRRDYGANDEIQS